MLYKVDIKKQLTLCWYFKHVVILTVFIFHGGYLFGYALPMNYYTGDIKVSNNNNSNNNIL